MQGNNNTREASKVLVKLSKWIGVSAAAAALTVSAWAQAAQAPAGQAAGQTAAAKPGEPQWKDRAEYDLFDSISKEPDANKRLALLNQWKEKYPSTDFQKQRQQFYIPTYQQLNDVKNMFASVNDLYRLDPKDLTAAYWLTILTPSMNVATDPAALERAENGANIVIQNLDTTFAREKKPATMSDADWAKQRSDTEAAAHKTLGWVQMVKKNNDAAEKHFREAIRLNPNAGEVDYWLGNVLVAQKDQKKIPEALFFLARAGSYTGPGALAPEGRNQVNAYLAKAYAGYHGSATDLDKLKQMAATNPVPPPDFKVKSVVEIQQEELSKQAEKEKADPQGALWARLKEALTGAEGPAYFDSNMKGSKLPEKALRGKVVSATTKEIKLAMSDDTTPEATLQFENAVPKVEPGTSLQFTGVAESYTKEPFMVTFQTERSDVVGLPASAPAKRKAPARPASRSRKR